MKATAGFNFHSFLLAAFFAGFVDAAQASAQFSCLIDLNSRTATDLGTLGGLEGTPVGC